MAPWEEYGAPSVAPWEEYTKPKPSLGEQALRATRFLTPSGLVSSLFTPEDREDLKNAVSGGVRGAGSIGATLVRPFESRQENKERRQKIDSALTEMAGADPQSLPYQAGKLATEVGGTWGAGGAAANALARVPGATTAIPSLLNAIRTGGVTTGANPVGFLPRAVDMGTRMVGGGVSGGLTAGMVDPEYAGSGAVVGAVAPPVLQAAGRAGEMVSGAMERGARRLMQSAIKPTIQQHRSGDAATAIDVLLERGLNPNARGVARLETAIDDVDNQITQSIANSTARVDKQAVADRLNQTRQQFRTQATPQNDLGAIDTVRDNFLSHPLFPVPQTSIPVQQAQEIKRGTYRVLSKKYGEMKGAETEAQKALARGLKEEIAAAVPGVNDLNAELSRLTVAREVAERRALMEANKNPGGLSLLAPSKSALLAFLADRSALLKSMGARGLYQLSPSGQLIGGLLGNPALPGVARTGLLLSNEASP